MGLGLPSSQEPDFFGQLQPAFQRADELWFSVALFRQEEGSPVGRPPCEPRHYFQMLNTSGIDGVHLPTVEFISTETKSGCLKDRKMTQTPSTSALLYIIHGETEA